MFNWTTGRGMFVELGLTRILVERVGARAAMSTRLVSRVNSSGICRVAKVQRFDD